MTEKELLYLEDALGHTSFLQTQGETAAQSLQDGALKNRAQEIAQRNKQMFDRFYGLV